MNIREILRSRIVVDARALWNKLGEAYTLDANVFDQARRSCSAVAFNFAEGIGAGGGRMRDKLNVSRGEAYECAVACSFLQVGEADALALADLVDEFVASAAEEAASVVSLSK